MSEVVLIRLAAPEGHVGDLEIAPEVAGAVAMGFMIMVWPQLAVHQPVQRIVFV